MVTHIDVLGPRVKLGKPCQFEGARVVFENLALVMGQIFSGFITRSSQFVGHVVHACITEETGR
jgi:hypothetical protein